MVDCKPGALFFGQSDSGAWWEARFVRSARRSPPARLPRHSYPEVVCSTQFVAASTAVTPRTAVPCVQAEMRASLRNAAGGSLATPLHTQASSLWIGRRPVEAVIRAAANVTDEIWS